MYSLTINTMNVCIMFFYLKVFDRNCGRSSLISVIFIIHLSLAIYQLINIYFYFYLYKARECSDKPQRVGVYNISPGDSHTFKVRCEIGGWTVRIYNFL